MNKINISEPLNLSSMTVPKGSIAASIVSRHAKTSAMCMHRGTRAYANKTHKRSACTRTPAPKAHPSARRSTSARKKNSMNNVHLKIMGWEFALGREFSSKR